MFLSQTDFDPGVFVWGSAWGEDANGFLRPDRPNANFLVGDLSPKYESDAQIITLTYDDSLAWRFAQNGLALANTMKISAAPDIDLVNGSAAVGIGASGTDFAHVNSWRQIAGERFDELSAGLTTFFGDREISPATPAVSMITGPPAQMDWQVRLVELVSDGLPGLIVPLPPDFIYRRGELIFASFLAFLEQVGSFEQALRRAASFVISFLQSRKGLASLFGAFVTQRSWYLRHSAHPPELPDSAVDGRFPSKRRTCFRPPPA